MYECPEEKDEQQAPRGGGRRKEGTREAAHPNSGSSAFPSPPKQEPWKEGRKKGRKEERKKGRKEGRKEGDRKESRNRSSSLSLLCIHYLALALALLPLSFSFLLHVASELHKVSSGSVERHALRTAAQPMIRGLSLSYPWPSSRIPSLLSLF